MTISEARKEVFEYLKLCGVGATPFTTALQTLYDYSLKSEQNINHLQWKAKTAQDSEREYFERLNERSGCGGFL